MERILVSGTPCSGKSTFLKFFLNYGFKKLSKKIISNGHLQIIETLPPFKEAFFSKGILLFRDNPSIKECMKGRNYSEKKIKMNLASKLWIEFNFDELKFPFIKENLSDFLKNPSNVFEFIGLKSY